MALLSAGGPPPAGLSPEEKQRARMIRMIRVNLLEELGGWTAELLKSRESLRNGTYDDPEHSQVLGGRSLVSR